MHLYSFSLGVCDGGGCDSGYLLVTIGWRRKQPCGDQYGGIVGQGDKGEVLIDVENGWSTYMQVVSWNVIVLPFIRQQN